MRHGIVMKNMNQADHRFVNNHNKGDLHMSIKRKSAEQNRINDSFSFYCMVILTPVCLPFIWNFMSTDFIIQIAAILFVLIAVIIGLILSFMILALSVGLGLAMFPLVFGALIIA